MDEFRYQTLRDCILEGRCVLVIGPDLFRYGNESLHQALYQHLKQVGAADKCISFFDFKDELFYFKGKNLAASKNAVFRQIREFYNGLAITELHQKIARIPFPLIVNLTPDLILANAFEKLGLAHEFRFYNKKLIRDTQSIQYENEEIFDASPEYPLIYNLVGHVGYEESLILTYGDLFDFLFNVFGRNNLPMSLRHILEIQDGNEEKKDYLFLGFTFNKWYLQVLLRLLNAQSGNQRLVLGDNTGDFDLDETAFAARDDKSVFYIQSYFMLDPIEGEPVDILHRLYEDCAAAGKLRQPSEYREKPANADKRQPLFMNLQDWIMCNKIRKAFAALRDFFQNHEDPQWLNMVLMAASRYEDILRQENQGLLYHNELSVEKSKIMSMLSQLTEVVKKEETMN